MAKEGQNDGGSADATTMTVEQRRQANEKIWKDDSKAAPERVAAWLDNRGTPLEFETAVAFSKAGFNVEQGLHEKQPDGKPLEVDVLAVKRELIASRQAILGHEVVVECKVAPRPWVAFSPLSAATSGTASYVGAKPLETSTVEAARYLYQHHGPQMRRAARGSVPNIWPSDRLAFALTNVRPQDKGQEKHQDNSDRGFEALTGLVSRCRFRRESHEGSIWHTTQLPLIVVGGELCMAEWDSEKNKMQVNEINSCIVEFRGDLVLPAVQVQVVTAKHLPKWLDAFAVHIFERQDALLNVTEDVESALREENLKQLELDGQQPEGLRVHRMLSRVLAQRTQVDRMRHAGVDENEQRVTTPSVDKRSAQAR